MRNSIQHSRWIPGVLMLLVVAGVVAFGARSFAQGPQTDSGAAVRELVASITPDQRAELRSALAAYQGDLESLAARLETLRPDAATAQQTLYLPLIEAAGAVVEQREMLAQRVNPDDATLLAELDAVNQVVLRVLSGIEADLARILTTEQLDLYHAAISESARVTEGTTTAPTPRQNTVNALGCFNAAQWANYGFAYVRIAKAFAIMSAFNVDIGTGTPEAVQAYILFNSAEGYALDTLTNAGAASVLFTATDPLVANVNGGTDFGVKANNALILAGENNVDATALALIDYDNTGNYFSFYAFAYGDVATFYLVGSLERIPNCF